MADSEAASQELLRTTTEDSVDDTKPPRRPEELIKKATSSVGGQFGSRFLTDEDAVFDFNAWDNVEWGEEQEQEAREVIAKQASAKVDDETREKYDREAAGFWDEFYSRNTNKFFKDRHWLRIEFPELFENLPKASTTQFNVYEIGCGAGNTVFPLLTEVADSNVFVYACDYSKVAIDVVKSSHEYNETKCRAFVYDITSEEPPAEIEPESIDICTCIFVLSAIHPRTWQNAIRNISRVLKPGGLLLFRDYGRYDLAQLRFKGSRFLEDNFYVRGDGTRVYFFTQEEIADMFKDFIVEQNEVDRRLIVNRSRKLKMYRVWLQGKFRKHLGGEKTGRNVE
ncbi:Methyltransferase-like protein 2-A [Borealophlyctis nickersoniae]|nr:Methyltransferase-like protein 2-A [Borealophlyctis nickersoniae]